jgi:hypothetical protein
MTPDRFRTACGLLGWSFAKLARELDIHPRRVRAFAAGSEVIPEVVETWLEEGAAMATQRAVWLDWLARRPQGPFRTPRIDVAKSSSANR